MAQPGCTAGSPRVTTGLRPDPPRRRATSSTMASASDDFDPHGLDHAAEDRQQMAVQFHGHHLRSGFGQRQAQGAQACPNPTTDDPGPISGQACDPPDCIGISDEVPAPAPCWGAAHARRAATRAPAPEWVTKRKRRLPNPWLRFGQLRRSPTGTCQPHADSRPAHGRPRCTSCVHPSRRSSPSPRFQTGASGWHTFREAQRRTTSPVPALGSPPSLDAAPAE